MPPSSSSITGMASEHPNCARREQVDMLHGLLHVARVKNGMPSVHRAQEYPAHRALYRAFARQVPRLLEGLISIAWDVRLSHERSDISVPGLSVVEARWDCYLHECRRDRHRPLLSRDFLPTRAELHAGRARARLQDDVT